MVAKEEQLKSLLENMDFDAEDLIRVVSALGQIKKKKDNLPAENSKVIGDKTYVLNRDDVYIYQDQRTKRKWWYIRIYEPRYKKVWSKSLKTTSKTVALALAEEIYSERKGRLSIGVRAVSIITRELVSLYQEYRRKELTDIPYVGIKQKSLDALCRHIKKWEEYIHITGHKNTKLEDIPTDLGKNFGIYIKGSKKKAFLKTPRVNGTINHTIAAVKLMYKFAIEEKYITQNEMPKFKYLKVDREIRPKRDVLTKEERESISKYLRYKYCKDTTCTKKELLKRRIFNLVFTIAHYTGMRPIELTKMKWKHISVNPLDDKFGQKKNRMIHIPKENSKTGRSRDIVAPIQIQLESIKKIYQEPPYELDIAKNPENYVFPRMTLTDIKNNTPTTRVAWEKRLKYVMQKSEELGYWESKGRNITLYQWRHHYITERLIEGVDMYQIALNCGTSLEYIQQTYSHLTTAMKSKEITKGLGAHNMKESSKQKIVNEQR